MFWHNFKYELITCFKVKDVLFWLMLFPIVLGLFFKAAFSGIYDKDFSNAAIKAAVVETTKNENFSAVLDSLSSGDDALLKITRTDMESAQKKLEDKSIDAIICVDGEISLQVRKNSTESTILERIVNQYTVNEKIISDTLKSDPSALAAVVSQLTGNTDYTENIRLADKRTDIYDQYFYNLIAMVALFSSISGLHIAIQNQGNLSELGARKCISPTPKFISMAASLSGTYILGIICVVLCVSFVRFVLGISLGENLILTYFAAIVGSILGTNTGFFIGSLNRINETVKAGFSIAFSMLSCNIERLGRRYAGNADLAAGLADRGKRNVVSVRVGEVTVYLVGNHRHIVFAAELAYFRKSFRLPDLSDRIVGIAEYHQRCLRIGKLILKVVPVDRIPAVLIDKRRFKNISAVVEN